MGRYGEKPFGILKFGFLIILLFSALFFATDSIENTEQNIEPKLSAESVKDYFYFSAVTFTTLGYGDLKPQD